MKMKTDVSILGQQMNAVFKSNGSALLIILGMLSISVISLFGAESNGTKNLPNSGTVQALIGQLASESYEQRENAHTKMLSLGARLLPALRGAEENTHDPEVRNRLKALIRGLARPRWQSSLEQAKLAAKSSGKPIMIFSTIGPLNGFS